MLHGSDRLIGQELGGAGQYRITALLGRGGMAAVYRAEHRTAAWQRPIAIKVLDPYLSSQPGFTSRFLREAGIVATLRHPHILTAFDFGEESGMLYLVMDLVEGGSLQDVLRAEGGQPWQLARVVQLADQILPALSAAHKRGIVHRDIKPSNILIDADTGFVFLCDFGIAKVAGDDAGSYQTRGFLGTPAYASPEQVTAQPLDGRADLYSFGVVLYRLITGRLPYEAAEPIALALQHLSGQLPPARSINPSVPPAVESVLNRALARAPEQRYPSGEEFRQALATAVADRKGPVDTPAAAVPVVQAETIVAPPIRAGVGRRLRPMPLALAGLVAAVGVMFAVLRLGTEAPETIAPQPTNTSVVLLVPRPTAQPIAAVLPTSRPTPAPSPTSAPTDEEAWSALQPVLNDLWSHDWPKLIATLEAFHQQHADHAESRAKLYDAYVEASKTVDQDQALEWLDRAISLMSERVEAPALHDALRATPTPTPGPTAVPAAPTPVRPTQIRPTAPAPPPPTPFKPAFATPVPLPTKPPFATPAPRA